MLRKYCILVLTALLFILPIRTGYVRAAAPCKAVSCYYLDDTFYAAVAAEDIGEQLKASILINNAVVGEPQTAVQPANDQIHYFLLIDLSSSMRNSRKCVEQFAESLCSDDTIHVTLAGFGNQFEVLEEDVDSKKQLRQILQKLKYDKTGSDISNAIVQALQYLNKQPVEAGTLNNLIVLTDGTPYIGTNGKDEKAIQEAAASAEALILSTPQMIVHTVYIGSDDPDKATKSATSAGTGLFLPIQAEQQPAQDAAEKIVDYTQNLSCFQFPLKWDANTEEMEIQLRLSNKEFVTYSHVRNLNQTPEETEPESITDENTETVTESESAAASETDETNTEQTDTTETSEISDTSDTSVSASETAESEQETETSIAPESDATPDQPEQEQKTNPTLMIVIVCIAVLLIAAVIIAFLISRRKNPDTAGNGIQLQMEVLAGKCNTSQREFRLQKELMIGSDRSCDIVLKDPSVSARNTRIYLKENAIYIEDLNQESVTQVAGMKIHAPNRLRSGDEITIGNVRLRFRF